MNFKENDNEEYDIVKSFYRFYKIKLKLSKKQKIFEHPVIRYDYDDISKKLKNIAYASTKITKTKNGIRIKKTYQETWHYDFLIIKKPNSYIIHDLIRERSIVFCSKKENVTVTSDENYYSLAVEEAFQEFIEDCKFYSKCKKTITDIEKITELKKEEFNKMREKSKIDEKLQTEKNMRLKEILDGLKQIGLQKHSLKLDLKILKENK